MFMLALLISFLVVIYFVFPKSAYKGPVSDHFDGSRFHNIPPDTRTFLDFFRWMLNRKPIPWPKKREITPAYPSARIFNELKVTFVNHATVLIQWDGFNILTDPIWAERCSPLSWFGPKRVHRPGIEFDHLPPIDLILLTHNHYDHMDLPTLKKINARNNPTIVTGLGNVPLLKRNNMERVFELDWWQEYRHSSLLITYVPAMHFAARGIFDRNKTLWGGFIVKNESGTIYFAGDTGYGEFFKEISKRFGPIDLSILPIGTYEPRWFMKPAHMSPKDAIKAHQELNSKKSLAIHFGTFHLSDEGIDEPANLLRKEMAKSDLFLDDFLVLNPGEARKIF